LAEEEAKGLAGGAGPDGESPLVLALDCDGTLFNDKGELSERSARALRRFCARGGAVVLATGHGNRAVQSVALELACNAYAICSSGAVTMTAPRWEVRWANTMGRATAARVAAALARVLPAGAEVAVEALSHWYVQGAGFCRELDNCMPGARLGQRVSKIAVASAPGQSLSDCFLQRADAGDICVRVMAVHPSLSAEEMLALVHPMLDEENAEHGGELEAQHAGAPRGIMITKKGVHKGLALRQVCEALGVPASRVWAFGDNQNDIEMFKFAGTGLAVANATPELKKAATRVLAQSNAQDAVAREIEQLLDRADDRAAMRDNLRRLQAQVARLETGAIEAAKENEALADAVLQHERVIDLIKDQGPAKLHSPALVRKRQAAGR
jgi:hydroxymethylpyrimidine pyrophosphatase-like HAD family hydrolase